MSSPDALLVALFSMSTKRSLQILGMNAKKMAVVVALACCGSRVVYRHLKGACMPVHNYNAIRPPIPFAMPAMRLPMS